MSGSLVFSFWYRYKKVVKTQAKQEKQVNRSERKKERSNKGREESLEAKKTPSSERDNSYP